MLIRLPDTVALALNKVRYRARFFNMNVDENVRRRERERGKKKMREGKIEEELSSCTLFFFL